MLNTFPGQPCKVKENVDALKLLSATDRPCCFFSKWQKSLAVGKENMAGKAILVNCDEFCWAVIRSQGIFQKHPPCRRTGQYACHQNLEYFQLGSVINSLRLLLGRGQCRLIALPNRGLFYSITCPSSSTYIFHSHLNVQQILKVSKSICWCWESRKSLEYSANKKSSVEWSACYKLASCLIATEHVWNYGFRRTLSSLWNPAADLYLQTESSCKQCTGLFLI